MVDVRPPLNPGNTVSYIVFKEGTNIYIKNGTTGKIVHSSTNAQTELQWVIDTVEGNGGGEISIRGGTYAIGTGLTIENDNVRLTGEGWEKTVLSVTSGNNGITVGNASRRTQYVVLKGFLISHGGTYANASIGIYLRNQTCCKVEDIEIYAFEYGIKVDSAVYFAGYNSYTNLLIGSVKYGFYQSGSAEHNGNTFTKVHCMGAAGPVAGSVGWQNTYGYANVLMGCTFETFATGLYLDRGSAGYQMMNQFIGISIESCTTGIDFGSSYIGWRNQFFGIVMSSVTTYIANNYDTANNEFFGLFGVIGVSRNHGSASVTSGSTIAHGCAFLPRFVHVSIHETTPYKISYTWNSTNITVYHDKGSAATVWWEAEI